MLAACEGLVHPFIGERDTACEQLRDWRRAQALSEQAHPERLQFERRRRARERDIAEGRPLQLVLAAAKPSDSRRARVRMLQLSLHAVEAKRLGMAIAVTTMARMMQHKRQAQRTSASV